MAQIMPYYKDDVHISFYIFLKTTHFQDDFK